MVEIFRKTIIFAILAFFVGVFIYRNEDLTRKYNPFFEYKCDIPVTYTIDRVDQEFGLPKEDFKKAVLEAEKKWEDALGRNVLEMKDSGKVKVNLVFDERQAGTKELKKMLEEIVAGEKEAESFYAQYEALKLSLEKMRSDYRKDILLYEKEQEKYQKDSQKYQADLKKYEDNVEYWNSRGGAPEDEYDKIIKKQKELDSQYKKLKKQASDLEDFRERLEKKRKEVNVLAARVNILAGAVNRISGNTNEKAQEYNQTQEERGEFETGLYKKEGEMESIDIFQFFDEKDLLAILIHEFGHAFGLEHATSDVAIMYPKLINKNADISPEDVAMFNEKCVKK